MTKSEKILHKVNVNSAYTIYTDIRIYVNTHLPHKMTILPKHKMVMKMLADTDTYKSASTSSNSSLYRVEGSCTQGKAGKVTCESVTLASTMRRKRRLLGLALFYNILLPQGTPTFAGEHPFVGYFFSGLDFSI